MTSFAVHDVDDFLIRPINARDNHLSAASNHIPGLIIECEPDDWSTLNRPESAGHTYGRQMNAKVLALELRLQTLFIPPAVHYKGTCVVLFLTQFSWI